MRTDTMESNLLGLDKIISLAKSGTDEDWETIDSQLQKLSQQDDIYNWSRKNLANENSNLRDLSASILEQTERELESETIKKLFVLMSEKDEENPYPSFRAACALAKRFQNTLVNPKLRMIEDVLRSFGTDEYVSEMAQKYLSGLAKK